MLSHGDRNPARHVEALAIRLRTTIRDMIFSVANFLDVSAHYAEGLLPPFPVCEQ